MASCGSLQQIFENPLPENPTLIQSLSPWNQIKSIKKPVEVSSFTEIFGELHFKENPESLPSISSPRSSASSSSFPMDLNAQYEIEKLENNRLSSSASLSGVSKNQFQQGCSKKSNGFSSKNSESLQLCTEGLGVESFVGGEESMVNDNKGDNNNWESHEKEKVRTTSYNNLYQEFKRSRTSGRSFPPPISSIARTGKPWFCFKSYRQDGRFVLKEVKIPTQEFLRAFREDGRLKLHFVHPDQGTIDEEQEQELGTTEEDEDEEGNDYDLNDDEKNKENEEETEQSFKV